MKETNQYHANFPTLSNMVTLVERRLYTRIWCEVPVTAYYGDSLLLQCGTVNLSVGGLLISAKDIGLTENSLIQVVFNVEQTHSLYMNRIPAVVLRNEKNQLAVSFENLEKGTEELINAYYMNSYPEYF